MNLPITREKALNLLNNFPQIQSDFNHYLESEAIMRELALKLGEDFESWSMLGLLHDVDWAITKEDTKEHLTKAPKILKDAGFDEEFISIVVSHGFGFDCANLKDKKRTNKIEFALAASETLTGLIHSYALMRGGKIYDMNAMGLMKKFKDKRFAAGCNREIIKEIENLRLSLEEFFEIGIEGIKNIKEDVGLK